MNGARLAQFDTIMSTSAALTRRAALRRLGAGGLLASGLTLGPGRSLLFAQGAAQADTHPIVAEWVAAWSAGDLERVLALYADDIEFEEVPTVPTIRGKDELRAVFGESLAALSDPEVIVTRTVKADDVVAIEGILNARYTGQVAGLPPGTGQELSLRIAAFFELADDKIRRETDYFDLYSFLVQIGAMPGPEEEGEG